MWATKFIFGDNKNICHFRPWELVIYVILSIGTRWSVDRDNQPTNHIYTIRPCVFHSTNSDFRFSFSYFYALYIHSQRIYYKNILLFVPYTHVHAWLFFTVYKNKNLFLSISARIFIFGWCRYSNHHWVSVSQVNVIELVVRLLLSVSISYK